MSRELRASKAPQDHAEIREFSGPQGLKEPQGSRGFRDLSDLQLSVARQDNKVHRALLVLQVQSVPQGLEVLQEFRASRVVPVRKAPQGSKDRPEHEVWMVSRGLRVLLEMLVRPDLEVQLDRRGLKALQALKALRGFKEPQE